MTNEYYTHNWGCEIHLDSNYTSGKRNVFMLHNTPVLGNANEYSVHNRMP